MLQNFCGGLYALARQLGQGDEYVEASMGQSQQMLATLGVNRAFTGWHGMQGMAHKAAVLENPEYLGVWGAKTSAETTATADTHRAAWLKSNVANQWGAALNVQRTYGNFRADSSAENYMRALERGDSTFERVYVDEQGNRRTEQWSVQMSETQWRQIVPESLDTDDPERIKAARSQMGAVLNNRAANQKAIHDAPELAASVQHAHASAQFTTGVAMASRASTARGYINQKAAEQMEQQGITATRRGRVMQQVYLEMADKMLDSDEVHRIVRDYGIDKDDPYFIGKIGTAIQKERFEQILRTADADSDEYKVAETYLPLMENQKDRDEMAVPIQHLLDEIGLNTGHQNAVNAMKNLSHKVASRQRTHVAVASEEQRRKDAYMEGFSQDVLTRISDSLGEGATFSEIVNAAFQMIDLDPESDLMRAHRDFTQANARVRRLEIEREQITRNRDLSEEDRETQLKRNEIRMKTAVQNLGDAQATLQPELRKMRLGFERMSTAEFDSRFGMDLDLLNQVVTVADPLTGRFKLRKLQKDEARMDAETGILQVREGFDWVEKQDAAYFAQLSKKSESGEEEHYFKELFRDNGRWKYRTENGELVEFDPGAKGAKMAVGTKILTRGQDGSVKASNYQWTNGFLTRTSDDGVTTTVLQDADGNYIGMDSELGKAIYASSEDGVLDLDLIEAIEANKVNLVTVLSKEDLRVGASARRHAAAAAEESKESVRQQKIRELANQYVDSTGAIGEINPVKIEMEGETFYMLTGFANKDRREQELARYREAVAEQQEELTAYFEADDSNAKRFEQNTNEELREARKAYRANKTTRERIQGRIAANQEKLKSPLSESEAERVRMEIARDQTTLDKLEPIGRGVIEQAAKEQARFARVDIQSEQVREISENSISTSISDPKLLDTIYRYGGQAAEHLEQTQTEQRFTAPELSDLIANMREAAETLPAAEQGALDVAINDLVRKKDQTQQQADRILRENFSEHGESGVKVMSGKNADPVKTDRFGNPVVITPVLRKDIVADSDPTRPTDIKQLQIGPGTYNALSGRELDTPVRVPSKAAIEVPHGEMQVMEEQEDVSIPATEPQSSVSKKTDKHEVQHTTTETSPIQKTPARERDAISVEPEQISFIPSDRPIQRKPRTILEQESIVLSQIEPFGEAGEHETAAVDKLSRTEHKMAELFSGNLPAESTVGRATIAAKPYGVIGGDPVGDCTLHANTVNFKVDSMDLKNGSVIVEAVGRGNRSGTSEQR